MLLAMILSIIFTIIDICSVTDALKSALPVGINPFWKLAFVFKLLTDCVILDDFKTALDKLCAFNLSRIEETSSGDNWAAGRTSGKKTTMKRDVTRDQLPLGNMAAVRRGGTSMHSEAGDAWIEVTTETRVDSLKIDEMGRHRYT
jgi:hypothetical protein